MTKLLTSSARHLKDRLAEIPALRTHPYWKTLSAIVTGKTQLSSADYPYISDESFRLFIESVPHLFQDGESILSWLGHLEKAVPTFGEVNPIESESMARAIKVVRTMVFTAGVTAPPDLWLLRQVLSIHKQLGILDWILEGKVLEPESFAEQRRLNARQLKIDLHFLHSRGYLSKVDTRFLISGNSKVVDVLKQIRVLKQEYRINLIPVIAKILEAKSFDTSEKTFIEEWVHFDKTGDGTGMWIASHFQIELGYRLLPLVLALRTLGYTKLLKEGASVENQIPAGFPVFNKILEFAGYAKEGSVTELGARVFERGPGAFGIIGAYYPYMNTMNSILGSQTVRARVNRGENVAASQDANRATFKAANDRLDEFCKEYGFHYTVFIEHAVGQGEATRQRFERNGEEAIRYFGADLEDAAIDQAIKQQEKGFLPRNMQFIRSADIGDPQKVIGYLQQQGLATESAVMMVGNGFHEIREQTNERMIEVFKSYQEAGIILIFTEESALADKDLLHTAWNTYHAGFRYVHEMSGQGLRPAWESEHEHARWSWRKCASLGGYVILDRFSYRTRTIYPYTRPHRLNPCISVTDFCVPKKLAKALGVKKTK